MTRNRDHMVAVGLLAVFLLPWRQVTRRSFVRPAEVTNSRTLTGSSA